MAAALLVDPLWALVAARPRKYVMRAYYLGAGIVLWIGWGAAVTVGLLLGRSPIGTAADVAVPVCLATLVIPNARTRAGVACVVVGALVGLVTREWPSGTGVLAAMLAGATAESRAGEDLMSSAWLGVLIVGVGSYGLRAAAAVDRASVSARARLAVLLRDAGTSALAALLASAVAGAAAQHGDGGRLRLWLPLIVTAALALRGWSVPRLMLAAAFCYAVALER